MITYRSAVGVEATPRRAGVAALAALLAALRRGGGLLSSLCNCSLRAV